MRSGAKQSSRRVGGIVQLLKEVCSIDGAFQVHFVEPGQDCKRALFIGQGDCTYMRAEDIEGSNLLDVMISNGGVLADFAGLANLAHAYSNARHTQV